MASVLSNLTGAAARSSEDVGSLQQGVGQNKAAAEKLLKEGRASGEVPSALVVNQGLNVSQGGSSAGISSPIHVHLQPRSRFPHQQVEKLLDRVEAARDVTSAALQGLQGSSDDLSAALTSLKGKKTSGAHSQP